MERKTHSTYINTLALFPQPAPQSLPHSHSPPHPAFAEEVLNPVIPALLSCVPRLRASPPFVLFHYLCMGRDGGWFL